MDNVRMQHYSSRKPLMDISEIRRINLATILRDHYHNNQAELARKIGVSPNNISRYFSDSADYGRSISDKAARDVEAATGLSYGWMDSSLNVLGQSFSSLVGGACVNDIAPVVYVAEGSENAVPLMNWDLVPHLESLSAEELRESVSGWVRSPTSLPPGSYALQLRGDSMQTDDEGSPSYDPGSLIFVKAAAVVKSGDFVIVAPSGSGDAVFKQLLVFEGEQYLFSLNSRYPAIAAPAEMRIIGIVV